MESEILKEMQTRMVKNFLDTIILAKLRNKSELSGYDAIDFIHKKFGILISSGTVYSILYCMERKGLIKASLNQRKRVYTLTDKGIADINALVNSKEKIQVIMGTLISA